MESLLSGWVRDTRATAAIEFAILMPVFLLMLTGMMAYGIYFGAANSIQQLTADAARIAIAGLDQAERNKLVGAFLTNNAGEYLLIDQTRVSFTIGDKPGDPTQYRVTVRYDASDLPIWNLYLPLPLPSPLITYTSVIRRGGI
ncbi:Flp pilus assembly protein TadG [Devosia sp. UYZn731]|uniref:TadE/TadG family type IV pilus assembly protein n=1 Tax=Devosia sp. UYZn731 TaxID=3156345 RepID=UPI0033910B47